MTITAVREKRGGTRLRLISVKLEPHMVERVDAVARTDRRSRSFVVRDAIALALALRERQAAAR